MHLTRRTILHATGRTAALVLALGLLALLPQGCVAPSTTTPEESQLIQTLQSAATAAEKDAVCVRLKRIGTAGCVPALAVLLTDEQLSHSARQVLEAMTAPDAGRSLIEALSRTAGPVKAGIIDSLGVRREARAVPALAAALRGADAAVATAAAVALGEIAGLEAVEILQRAGNNQPAPVQRAIFDASLRCAYRLLSSGERAKARALFLRLHSAPPEDHLRLAAFRGLVLASGPESVALASGAIIGRAGLEQVAALQLVHELDVTGATVAFARLLPQVEASMQVALIEALSQRDDPAALPAIAALAESTEPAVRLAVLKALGSLGNATTVARLAEVAGLAKGAEQAAAREALITLRHGQPAEVMLDQLAAAKPVVQAELARALAALRERAAVPKLLALASQGSESASNAAVLALARLGDFEPSALGALVQLIVEAKDAALRAAAATGLASACQHVRFRHGRVDAAPLLQGMANGPAEACLALLPICAKIDDPQVRTALRAAMVNANPRIRNAALAALCDTTDVELLPDLTRLAGAAPDAELRIQATAACVRLATAGAVKVSAEQQLDTFRAILAAAPNADQKRLVLAAVGEVPEPGSMGIAISMLAESAVRDDAALAIVKLAPLLPDPAKTEAALKGVLAVVSEGAIQQAADLALRQSRSGFGFITAWQVNGPNRQEGRDYADLFEFVFQPETGERQGVKWNPLPTAMGSTRTWLVELREPIGLAECVTYARTWLYCDAPQPVQLRTGSDSSLKIWLNQKLIHANSATRALRPGAERISTPLNSGWNLLLVKITQRSTGGAFCVQLLKPDGEPINGLKIDATDQAKH